MNDDLRLIKRMKGLLEDVLENVEPVDILTSKWLNVVQLAVDDAEKALKKKRPQSEN